MRYSRISRFITFAKRNWKYEGVYIIHTDYHGKGELWMCLKNKGGVHELIIKYKGWRTRVRVDSPDEISREYAEFIRGGKPAIDRIVLRELEDLDELGE